MLLGLLDSVGARSVADAAELTLAVDDDPPPLDFWRILRGRHGIKKDKTKPDANECAHAEPSANHASWDQGLGGSTEQYRRAGVLAALFDVRETRPFRPRPDVREPEKRESDGTAAAAADTNGAEKIMRRRKTPGTTADRSTYLARRWGRDARSSLRRVWCGNILQYRIDRGRRRPRTERVQV